MVMCAVQDYAEHLRQTQFFPTVHKVLPLAAMVPPRTHQAPTPSRAKAAGCSIEAVVAGGINTRAGGALCGECMLPTASQAPDPRRWAVRAEGGTSFGLVAARQVHGARIVLFVL